MIVVIYSPVIPVMEGSNVEVEVDARQEREETRERASEHSLIHPGPDPME